MGRTILPSGEELSVTPEELLRYMNPDSLRQLLRQERLRWNLKTNKDVDYYDNTNLFKYSGEVHNNGSYQKMEIRTFPDNGAYPGYAGINVDSGVIGLLHNLDKWDKAISDESLTKIINRVTIGAFAKVDGKEGYGVDDDGNNSSNTTNRAAAIAFDPYDGRAYLYSNDRPAYANNEAVNPDRKIPDRTVARLVDIPTRVDQLINDISYITDPDYKHTDNNFTHSNRYMLDNMDDRTFVYPEISKDVDGNYIKNIRIGLDGTPGYAESDGAIKQNTQPDYGIERGVTPNGDRGTDAVSSYNKNVDYSGSNTEDGFLHGVFRSIEELEKVDLVGQTMIPLSHSDAPGARRDYNYYRFDGRWSSNWFDPQLDPSYSKESLNPANMEISVTDCEPTPYKAIDPSFSRSKMYQWRYNRVDLFYYNENIHMNIIEAGQGYIVGDILRWTFGDDSFKYEVTQVGANGQIQSGRFIPEADKVYDQDPSTYGVGVVFQNISGPGNGAKLEIVATATPVVVSTQIKNNLYAYVDITPQVRSDNTSPWSDTALQDNQDGKVVLRSTAAGPAFSGVNSGKGGPDNTASSLVLYEHGGNPTAGVHVHLFRYVINTQNPTYVEVDGVKVYTGAWVDQGPIGLERPCDIKSLYLSNGDTNNFNNYYKFMLDLLTDSYSRNPDSIVSNNPNAVCFPYIHIDEVDPDPDRRFTDYRIDPVTSKIIEVDITSRVIYINAASGVPFLYNTGTKNDPTYGYAHREPGWFPLAGSVSP